MYHSHLYIIPLTTHSATQIFHEEYIPLRNTKAWKNTVLKVAVIIVIVIA